MGHDHSHHSRPNPPPAVAILPPEVARVIAAGEVIERPASVVRELVDNSLDAGAMSITAEWDTGGMELIRVHDDGGGMARADLELCWKPHATSKIRTVSDLEHASSLGFRGEALSSIAAVAELSIASTVRGAETGYRLDVRGDTARVAPAPPAAGTTVEVRRLFAELPARRRFLSRAQGESGAIRNTIQDRALAWPEIRFSYGRDGEDATVMPPETMAERVARVFGSAVHAGDLSELSGSGEGFHATIVAAHPDVMRRDRRLMQVCVNRRRVWEYKLVQAIEYAYRDVQHGGVFPVAALFLDVDPELVDFNIHPAKREVRLRTMGEIHHRVVDVLRSWLRAYARRTVQLDRELFTSGEAVTGPRGERGAYPGGGAVSQRPAPRARVTPSTGAATARHDSGRRNHGDGGAAPFHPELKAVPPGGPRAWDDLAVAEGDAASGGHDAPAIYRGTIFGTYLIVERGERVYLIDQHAAHERLLYDRFAAARIAQPLLVPHRFAVSPDEDAAIERHQEEYARLGIRLDRRGPGEWELAAMPVQYRERTGMLVETIRELGGLNDALDRRFIAEIACKAALKAGDFLDGLSADNLIAEILSLEEPRCPHGRPLWVELRREDLDKLIGRR